MAKEYLYSANHDLPKGDAEAVQVWLLAVSVTRAIEKINKTNNKKKKKKKKTKLSDRENTLRSNIRVASAHLS
jgi:large-conductance mechanosensitive channel